MKYTREIKASLIGLLAIVGFFMLFQVMKGKNFFSSDSFYWVKYENVEGLQKSNPVTINGLKVGMVEDIKPNINKKGEYYFEVKISVDKSFKFSKNSTVSINEPSLMSGKEMKINVRYEPPYAVNGDLLNGDIQLSGIAAMSSQVGPVKDQLTSVLSKLDSTMVSTNKVLDQRNRREIQNLLANLNVLSKSFEATSNQANGLIQHNDAKISKILDQTSTTMTTAKQSVDEYGKLAKSIEIDQLNQTLKELKELSGSMNRLVSNIENGKGTLGKAMKNEELYDNLNKSAANLNALLEDVKTNPKRYINVSVFGKNK